MPSHEPPKRSGDLELTTLAIAAAASAAAAFVTSQVWPAGTLWSAAASPVIVALVKEALARPADRIQMVRTRVPGGPAPGEPARGGPARGGPEAGAPEGDATSDQVKVYGTPRRRRWRLAVVTGLVAFAAVVVVYTVPELVTGQSLGRGGDGRTTLFGGEPRGTEVQTRDDRDNDAAATPTPVATPTPTPTPTATPDDSATPTATPTPAETPALPPVPTP